MKPLTDVRTLQAFAVVAREGNVSRAANRLNLTQPAVSLQLKRLADDTGLTLFTRTPHGLALTREGAALAAKAEQVLGALVDFRQTARHLTGRVQGRLRVGTIIDPEFTRLGAFLSNLLEAAPGIETELFHGISGDVPERIVKGALDVGYFLGDPNPGAADQAQGSEIFACRELTRFTYCVVAPAGWVARVRGRDWADLAALPWIGTPPASVHNRLLTPLFSALGVRQNRVAMVDQEASMLAMVRSGVGLSLCRESIALHEQQTQGLAIADRARLDCALNFICLATQRAAPNIDTAFEVMDRVWL